MNEDGVVAKMEREDLFNKFEQLFSIMDVGVPYKGPEMFSIALDEDYNNQAEGHKDAYSALWTFLERKVKEEQGFKDYSEGRRNTSFIKMDTSDLSTPQKCVWSWNLYNNQIIPRQNLIWVIKKGWGLSCTDGYIGNFITEIANFVQANVQKIKTSHVYTVKRGDPQELVDHLYKYLRSKKKAKAPSFYKVKKVEQQLLDFAKTKEKEPVAAVTDEDEEDGIQKMEEDDKIITVSLSYITRLHAIINKQHQALQKLKRERHDINKLPIQLLDENRLTEFEVNADI